MENTVKWADKFMREHPFKAAGSYVAMIATGYAAHQALISWIDKVGEEFPNEQKNQESVGRR